MASELITSNLKNEFAATAAECGLIVAPISIVTIV
jgi:Flp pilus assembly pilin Flp